MKILFTDCDDTLLTTDKKVCDRNREAIDKMIEAGHKIVLASGRSLPSTKLQAESIGLTFDGCYIIAFNGGEIYDYYNDNKIFKAQLPMDIVEKVFQMCEERGIHVQTYDDRAVISHEKNDSLIHYCEKMACEYEVVDNVVDYMKEGPCKILVVDYHNHDNLEEMRIKILDLFGDIVDSYYSNQFYLEVVPKGVNKGAAIHKLSEYLGVPMENTVAAGDNMNDITMIEEAHVGVAVANAVEAAKEAADYVTVLDNNEGAVAELIEKFILNLY